MWEDVDSRIKVIFAIFMAAITTLIVLLTILYS